MWFKKAADTLDRGLKPLILVVSKIGAGILALIILSIVADVMGRYFFNKPITGVYEISAVMLVFVSIFSVVYCQYQRGHISIDVITGKLKYKTKNIFSLFTYVLYVVTFALLTFQMTRKAISEWETGSLIRNTEIPVSPFVFVAAFGCILFTIIILMHLLLYLANLIRHD